MSSRDNALDNLPFCGSAEAYLTEARRRMDLAKASPQDEERERYETQAVQMYQEARIMDRDVVNSDTTCADIAHMWVDLAPGA